MRLLDDCNIIELTELSQYDAIEQREAFTKACLASALDSNLADFTRFSSIMAESLSLACPNIGRFKTLLNEMLSSLRAISLTQLAENEAVLLSNIEKLERCQKHLIFSGKRNAELSSDIIFLANQYEKKRQRYNGLLEEAEHDINKKTPACAFFQTPHFEHVLSLTELISFNRTLALSNDQEFVSHVMDF